MLFTVEAFNEVLAEVRDIDFVVQLIQHLNVLWLLRFLVHPVNLLSILLKFTSAASSIDVGDHPLSNYSIGR